MATRWRSLSDKRRPLENYRLRGVRANERSKVSSQIRALLELAVQATKQIARRRPLVQAQCRRAIRVPRELRSRHASEISATADQPVACFPLPMATRVCGFGFGHLLA